ncbi:MAG TPA: pyridoxal phosphate-dependent aminotransferase [Kofleriaceae bacterium]|nr:pyridoxal phosphate-dependent aminotransferase [Kofleriaceae bacterium]
MAKHPALSVASDALPLSIFARLFERLARFEGDVVPFHIGDTYLAPPEASRLGALGFSTGDEPGLYQYSSPTGDTGLVDALVDKVRRINRMSFAGSHSVQLTCGATHALSCSMRAVMDPSDEMLLLSPYWPLIRGIAKSCSVVPVEVPFGWDRLRQGGPVEVAAMIEPYITARTAAIYVCNPNNPDGKLLTGAELDAIVQVAVRHNLWVLADEVYEHFIYDGLEHRSIATLPGMAERTLTAFSFSKSYGQAGLRAGYVVGPGDAVEAIRKMVNHTVYSVPRAVQRAAHAALVGGDSFLDDARERYQRARDLAAARVQAPCAVPQGCTYLFLDLGAWMGPNDDCSLVGADGPSVLERIAEAGLLLAPGVAFGRAYGNWARLCFSSVPEPRLIEGIDRLNRALEALPARVRP